MFMILESQNNPEELKEILFSFNYLNCSIAAHNFSSQFIPRQDKLFFQRHLSE